MRLCLLTVITSLRFGFSFFGVNEHSGDFAPINEKRRSFDLPLCWTERFATRKSRASIQVKDDPRWMQWTRVGWGKLRFVSPDEIEIEVAMKRPKSVAYAGQCESRARDKLALAVSKARVANSSRGRLNKSVEKTSTPQGPV